MKHSAEYDRFTNLVDRLMSVPHAEILRREEEYRKQVDTNPKRRGPKRKKAAITPPSSSGPEANG